METEKDYWKTRCSAITGSVRELRRAQKACDIIPNDSAEPDLKRRKDYARKCEWEVDDMLMRQAERERLMSKETAEDLAEELGKSQESYFFQALNQQLRSGKDPIAALAQTVTDYGAVYYSQDETIPPEGPIAEGSPREVMEEVGRKQEAMLDQKDAGPSLPGPTVTETTVELEHHLEMLHKLLEGLRSRLRPLLAPSHSGGEDPAVVTSDDAQAPVVNDLRNLINQARDAKYVVEDVLTRLRLPLK